MIVQQGNGSLLLFRQTDHALLSGAFADAWGNDVIPPLERRDALLVAAARHDDGWFEWELAPKLNKDGEPLDFIHIPVSEHVALYRRGIDLVEQEDPFAGLVASMHGERLYTRPFYPGLDPRIEHLEGTNLELATAYVEGERARQQRLMGSIDGDGLKEDAEEGWRLLQVWDRLSLLVCMQALAKEPDQKLPPIASSSGDVQILARGTKDGDLVCDPYPFAYEPATFVIEGFQTDQKTWGSESQFRRDVRNAERVLVTFTCRSG
ncbi:MAG TPA: DUF3891 family protein [Actinomycetota bacterium]|nr:DUF3891 family protein [Actinomycetota bacterium]